MEQSSPYDRIERTASSSGMASGLDRTEDNGSFSGAASGTIIKPGYDPGSPAFSIEDVEFVVGRAAIECTYRTTEGCGCVIRGSVFDRVSMTFEEWLSALVLHASPHDHTITGLAPDTDYAVRLYAINADDDEVWRPSETGYYIVRTAGTGPGGLVATKV